MNLFISSGPSDISWLIIAVIILSVNCVLWGRRVTDMSIEGLKVVLPFWANCNSPFNVVFNTQRVAHVTAAAKHQEPCSVNFSSAFAVFKSVGVSIILAFKPRFRGQYTFSKIFDFLASTRLSFFSYEDGCGNPSLISALAIAEPIETKSVGAETFFKLIGNR